METEQGKALTRLNNLIRRTCQGFKPPEDITVSQWADKYRTLQSENSAEVGRWRTTRTPYLREIMDAFTDPAVKEIAVVASSQVGKTEMLLNILAYVIDQDPATIMFGHPTIEEAEKFSKQRISPMIRDIEKLRTKVQESKSRFSGNTIRQKIFPGGVLNLVGSNSPASLASVPARYVFGDEVDRWAKSAGSEGDPWDLLKARTSTFYNAKRVRVST
ncbi:MAG: phage terminase large subunit family protein, partial [Lachnospiraceae bacterium]|nr:phage terminase large subunit family protein [Lachnospiraceae bacterium]